jgi:hypothetical protein
MILPKNSNLPVPVSVEEHKALIDSLPESEYIFMFDSRVRVAITLDTSDNTYYVTVCSMDGHWFIIDAYRDTNDIEPSFVAAAHAVLVAWGKTEFDSDLKTIGQLRV